MFEGEPLSQLRTVYLFVKAVNCLRPYLGIAYCVPFKKTMSLTFPCMQKDEKVFGMLMQQHSCKRYVSVFAG